VALWREVTNGPAVLGDVAVHPAQLSEPDWVFSGDFDGQLAIATRRRYLDRAESEGMTLLQCHFPSPGYGRIVRLAAGGTGRGCDSGERCVRRSLAPTAEQGNWTITTGEAGSALTGGGWRCGSG